MVSCHRVEPPAPESTGCDNRAMATATVHRQCNLCEAHCGINVEVDGAKVVRITGDPEDEFSRGYICPKAAALADLYEDPDRLTKPVRRTAAGWEEMEWDEALDFAADGLRRVRDDHGRDAVATYLGNPGAHTWSVLSFLALRLVLGTSNNSSATSTDQLPQHLTSAEMFGNLAMFPIPDVDRTQHMLVLGANPADVRLLFYTPLPFAGAAAPATSGRRPAAPAGRRLGHHRGGRRRHPRPDLRPRSGADPGQRPG